MFKFEQQPPLPVTVGYRCTTCGRGNGKRHVTVWLAELGPAATIYLCEDHMMALSMALLDALDLRIE